MESGQPLVVRVQAFDPAHDAAPRYETHEVPYQPHMRVLDALVHINEVLGERLAFRWICGTKKCGACGILVNGVPRLACWAPVEPKMTLEPLKNYPIARDLVVDRTPYEKSARELRPYLFRGAPASPFPERLSHADFNPIFPFYECLECGLCVSACPAFDGRPSGFPGPQALVQLAKFAFDPRDRMDRSDVLDSRAVFDCMSCYRCETVCPVKLPIVEGAIERIKHECLSRRKSNYVHAEAFVKLLRENGIVDGGRLVARLKGVTQLIRNFRMALALLMRRKLRLRAAKDVGAANDVAVLASPERPR